MWLSKLVLTSLLTDLNAIQNGLGSLMMWLGADGYALSNGAYRPGLALKQVAGALLQDRDGVLFFLILAIAALGFMALKLLRGKASLGMLLRNWPLLLLASMPIIWFMVSAEPTTVHYWFQYRSVVLCFWALFGLAHLTIKDEGKRKSLLF